MRNGLCLSQSDAGQTTRDQAKILIGVHVRKDGFTGNEVLDLTAAIAQYAWRAIPAECAVRRSLRSRDRVQCGKASEKSCALRGVSIPRYYAKVAVCCQLAVMVGKKRLDKVMDAATEAGVSSATVRRIANCGSQAHDGALKSVLQADLNTSSTGRTTT